jgi:septum formation protein
MFLPADAAAPRLILASTSRYRRELLARLGLDFTQARPDADETPQPGEAPAALAVRLARAKAEAVLAAQAAISPGDGAIWSLGSDQVAALAGDSDSGGDAGAPIGKPGTREAAIAQLRSMRGRSVLFHTALCLAGSDGRRLDAVDLTRVRFRADLDDAEIARYVEREQPLDCAGSFKCEGLGIALFEAIDNRDPTALIGLPLIATARLLREAGFAVL